MPQTISDLRAALDGLDAALVQLLEQRFELTDEIGRLKCADGRAVRDAARERQVLEQVTLVLSDKTKLRSVSSVYEAILAASRRRQEELR